MKPKPYEAQNTKFSEYQRSLLISYATFELLKFENRTEVIIKFSRFPRHRRPGMNEMKKYPLPVSSSKAVVNTSVWTSDPHCIVDPTGRRMRHSQCFYCWHSAVCPLTGIRQMALHL